MSAISLIIPVYKVEPYLRCCLDSILAQTFGDFEVILVDDGSPDNCGAICDEYAKLDERFRVIHQKNGGISSARNAGLDWVFANSDSQWIGFIDSDDSIVPTYLEHLYNFAVGDRTDIVCCNFYAFSSDEKLAEAPCQVFSASHISGREACSLLYDDSMVIGFVAWGKLFSRELLADHRFPLGKVYEDAFLIPKLLYLANDVTILRAWLYCYRHRPGSILHETFSLRRFDEIDALDSCISFFDEHGEKRIKQSTEKKRKLCLAKHTLLARASKMLDQVPERYHMSVWRAFAITTADTLKRGGMKFIFHRIKNMKDKLPGKLD